MTQMLFPKPICINFFVLLGDLFMINNIVFDPTIPKEKILFILTVDLSICIRSCTHFRLLWFNNWEWHKYIILCNAVDLYVRKFCFEYNILISFIYRDNMRNTGAIHTKFGWHIYFVNISDAFIYQFNPLYCFEI